MTETNIVMDEKGDMFVPWNDGSNKEEMSVDGPPQESEQSIENESDERTGVESPPENKTVNAVILVEEALQRLSDLKDTNNGKGCSQDKTEECSCNFVTGPQPPDKATNEIQLTKDNDGDGLSIVKPSENPLKEDSKNLWTKSNADSVDTMNTHSDCTAEVYTQQEESTTSLFENNQSQGHQASSTIRGEENLSSNLLVQSRQSKTGNERHRCSEDAVVVVAEPKCPDDCSEVVCSKARDENGRDSTDNGTASLSEVNSPESKPSKEHTGMELKDQISTMTEDTLKLPTQSSPEEMKPQKEKASPNHLDNSQSQPVSSVTPDSPQRKTSVTLKRTTSGAYLQIECKSDPFTDKDQLYPLRKMQEEKNMESLTQAKDLTLSDTEQYTIQENTEEHCTERSIQKPKEEGSETPNSKKDETKAKATAQHLVPQMESSTMKKQPEIQKDFPVEEMKSDAVHLCHEEKNVKETVQPNQVNEVSVTHEDINTPPPSNIVATTKLQSPEEKTSVQREEVLTEPQTENSIDLTKTENTVHEQMLQVESSMENRPSVVHNDIPVESKQMTTEASPVCPGDSLVKEQVSASVSPKDIKSLCVTRSRSPSPENKAIVLREEALSGSQIEKTLENGQEATVERNIATESKEANKHSNAETEPHQGINNSVPEVNHDRENDADGLVTKTVSDPREIFPRDVLQEQDQNTQPKEQPFYSEPSGDPEHLYVEPEEVQLIEDPYLRQQVGRLDHVTLNIAVTGMTGAGKSTFINAIRGIDNDNEKAAPTGVTETSMDVCAYPHPSMPNVNLWDLPGTGSPKFKAKKYLKYVKFELYDFFIIISSERFKENDMMLAREILNKNKKFYFLRSKIDNEVRAEQCKKNFDEEKLLDCIREDCINHLKKIVKPTVFLICSFELNKYDFPRLVDTLSEDLPEHKKDALTLSLPIFSTMVLEEKIKTLTQTAQSAAKTAAAISVAPVPGLAIACDAGILLAFFTKCYYAFGLDDKSLDKLSERVNIHSLKAVRESRPLVMAVRRRELSDRELSELRSKRAAIEFAYSLVPVWGSKRAASMSRTTTLSLLNEGLKELADTAREVLKMAKIDHI